MEKAAVIHFARDQFLSVTNERDLSVMMMAKKSDLKEVALVYGDPFELKAGKWVWQTAPLVKAGSDEVYDYWKTTFHPATHRARYCFLLTDNEDQQIYFTEKGFYNELPADNAYLFCKPYVHASEQFKAPEWVKDTIWYQIFPERFANGDSSLNPKDCLEWASEEPTPQNFFGGDLEGVIQHLDHLSNLKVSGIYFTPIFKAFSNHKYDTIDYMALDEQFGTKDTLKRLVDECHKRGIRVMLDAVFNHSGYFFQPFQDVLKNGADSKYVDWFHPHSLPLTGGDRPNYETFAFVETMPKLNTQNEAVRQYFLDVAKYWIKECDIDGWRLDVANEVDHAFWRDFRKAVHEVKPDAYILGEVWHDSINWLHGDQFDAVMNYPLLTAIWDLFAQETLTAKALVEKMTQVQYMYPPDVNAATFNLIGSHDTARILTKCHDNLAKVKQIFTLLLTYYGTPCIYYGDEIGMDGEFDPGCRKCMEWDVSKQDAELFQHVRKLNSLRIEHPALANKGDLVFIDNNNVNVVLYKRFSNAEVFYVVISVSDESQMVSLQEHQQIEFVYQDGLSAINNNQVTLAPNGYGIVEVK